MCTGSVYDLVCGHQLIHFSTSCAAKCALPTGHHETLNDTCAPCTPSFQRTNIRRKYDQLQLNCVAAMRIAKAVGHREEEARLSRLLRQFNLDRDAEMARVNELERKLGAGRNQGVMYPGMAEDTYLGEMGGGEEGALPEETKLRAAAAAAREEQPKAHSYAGRHHAPFDDC